MDRLSTIKFPVAVELEQFKRLFDSSLTSSNPLLSQALAYIGQRNGKMMRPILVLLIARLFGKVTDATLYSAVSLELLHTASLVHDDVVDESFERRGQASVNAVYNNKVSILVGDYLLATCLMYASRTLNHRIVEAIACLGQDLSEGEILQLSNIGNEEVSETVYFDVIRKKTAALFAAATKVGALSVGADEENTEKARLFGEYIGICFQIKDDIFDYYDDPRIGKPTGNDMREGKLTLPAIYALNKVHDSDAWNLAHKVKDGKASDEEISLLIESSKRVGGIEYANDKMLEYKKRAEELITDLSDTGIKEALIGYIDYVISRVK